MIVGEESAGTALACLVEEPTPDFIDARLKLVGRNRLIEAEVIRHRFRLEPANRASVVVVDGAVTIADAVGSACYISLQSPAIRHNSLHASSRIGQHGVSVLIEFEVRIHKKLVREVKVFGICSAIDNLTYHDSRGHGIESKGHILCRSCLIREASLGVAVHHIIAPNVRFGITFDALRSDGTCSDAHSDQKVVGCCDGESGQATYDNLIVALFQRQSVLDIRPFAASCGDRVGCVVDGPDGNALVAYAEVVERLP